MKKIIWLISIIFCVIFYTAINKFILAQNNVDLAFLTTSLDYENQVFNKSYSQITDSMTISWDSTFLQAGIRDNPLGIIIFFIRYFSNMNDRKLTKISSLGEILLKRKSNIKSSALATCAIMQKLGWDVLCFYDENECYLGINLAENWKVRRGSWVEKNRKGYYLKEFDDYTPVGELKLDAPAPRYKSIGSKRSDLKPIPLITTLPNFADSFHEKELRWYYQDKEYTVKVFIPKEQIEWTRNLPPSLFGTIASGIEELKNINLARKLKLLVDDFQEYDKINFIYKFCQSESVFIYDSKQSIRSISIQLMEGQNDCDGRSVFLYCLLSAVLDYDDDDIIFISWPNHLALGVRPQTSEAENLLRQGGFYTGDRYYVLDAAYCGDTYWGSKMARLPDECEIIR